ncbi:MAG: hypothetical protein J6A75_04155 [Lachnospiraceae bacterium]|nr:hypothetical protein [Lachnospiraceae bacterium]
MDEKLIGLRNLKKRIAKICEKAEVYRLGGKKLPHIIMELPKGNGQGAVSRYIANCFYNNEILDFSSGFERVLLYTIDGSIEQLKKISYEILGYAVYKNHFEGVVCFDISEMTLYLDEIQMHIFLDLIADISKHAVCIFFLREVTSKNSQKLIKNLKENLYNLEFIDNTPYTNLELAGIALNSVKSRGIEVKEERKVLKELVQIMKENEIGMAYKAIYVADKIVEFADYTGFVPVISYESIEQAFLEKEKEGIFYGKR